MMKSKYYIFLLLVLITPIILNFGNEAIAELYNPNNLIRAKPEYCSGTKKDGTKIDKWDFRKILQNHEEWVKTNGKNGEHADLRGSNLNGFILTSCDYIAAINGTEIELSRVFLSNSNLRKSSFASANLNEAKLWSSDLSFSHLYLTKLKGADLSYAILTGAYLESADLTNANLHHAQMKDALLDNADLTGAIFEVQQNSLPYISSIATARGLSKIKYNISPASLFELREKFIKSGLSKQALQITYAIKNVQYDQAMASSDAGAKIFALVNKIAFDWSCKWGLSPLRPLIIVFCSIFFFAFIFYYKSINTKEKKDGIWKVWEVERVRKDLGGDEAELLNFKGWKCVRYSLHFSALSAFHVGWRDLNIGSWLSRLQLQEYSFRASGVIRLVSGIQSLLSVYMLVIWFLSTFSLWFQTH